MMELRVLNYFLMVSQEENITKAAQLLHVTQPTLSRQLMQLEDELGVKLFERSNHSIVLTSDGLLLKRRAQEIVSLAEKTKRELTTEKELSGEIEIGSGEFKSFSLLADVIAAFSEKHPGVRFHLNSGNADTIKERLENGGLDIGLLADPVDISRYEFTRLPQKETWGIIAHNDFAIAKRPFVTPKDLIGLPLILPHRRMVREEIQNWFGDLYGDVNVFATYDLLYNAAIMAQKKMGIILTIELESRFDEVKFVPFAPKMEFGSVLVWKKNQIQSAAMEAFIDFSKKYIKSISANAI